MNFQYKFFALTALNIINIEAIVIKTPLGEVEGSISK